MSQSLFLFKASRLMSIEEIRIIWSFALALSCCRISDLELEIFPWRVKRKVWILDNDTKSKTIYFYSFFYLSTLFHSTLVPGLGRTCLLVPPLSSVSSVYELKICYLPILLVTLSSPPTQHQHHPTSPISLPCSFYYMLI